AASTPRPDAKRAQRSRGREDRPTVAWLGVGSMDEQTPASRILAMLDGYRVVQALYVGAQLGIPDLLKDGPRHSDELAESVGAAPRSLHRLLRALASLDILQETPDQRFALTKTGHLLRADVAGSLRPAVLFFGGRRHWT